MKAISPIISIIILLLITITIAGAGYSYLSTYWTGLTSKQIQVINSFCVQTGHLGKILIKNIGTGTINTGEITIFDKQTGNDITQDVQWSSGVSDPGLVLELKFDNEAKPGLDTSGQENHGTVSGATWTNNGKIGGAFEFNINEESLILNYMIWKDGQTGSVGSFGRNGDVAENYRVVDEDPWGRQVVVWEARPDTVSGADGGWNHAAVAIDNTKLYRFSTWVNRKVMGTDGRFYLGTRGYGSVNGVKRLTGDTNYTNPYFWTSGSPPGSGLPEDEWILVVAHVHPYDHTGTSNHVDSGRYYANGTRLGSISNDFKWLPETTTGNHRSYLYYCTDTSVRQQWIYPRVDIVDGTEPSIEELINGYGNYGGDIVVEVAEDKESFAFWYVNNSNGNWIHVVNSSGTLYVNGELGTPDQYTLYVSENSVYIGRTTASDFFNGTIDEVRIYNRALEPDEIKVLAENSVTVRPGKTAAMTHTCTGRCSYNLILGMTLAQATIEC